jgi:hypothetical protein
MTLLKKTKTSMPLVAIFIIIALGIAGFSFAHWEKYMWIKANVQTGLLCAEFVPRIGGVDVGVDWTCGTNFKNPAPAPRPDGKNIGNSVFNVSDADGDGCNDTVNILLNNTYPSYYEEITVHLHNCGTIPLKIWKVIFFYQNGAKNVTVTASGPDYFTLDLNGDDKPDVEIQWGDNIGVQIDVCVTKEISWEIHVLQDAPQNTTMHFDVEFVYINWNENP